LQVQIFENGGQEANFRECLAQRSKITILYLSRIKNRLENMTENDGINPNQTPMGRAFKALTGKRDIDLDLWTLASLERYLKKNFDNEPMRQLSFQPFRAFDDNNSSERQPHDEDMSNAVRNVRFSIPEDEPSSTAVDEPLPIFEPTKKVPRVLESYDPKENAVQLHGLKEKKYLNGYKNYKLMKFHLVV
jgi:hypothetical protein